MYGGFHLLECGFGDGLSGDEKNIHSFGQAGMDCLQDRLELPFHFVAGDRVADALAGDDTHPGKIGGCAFCAFRWRIFRDLIVRLRVVQEYKVPVPLAAAVVTNTLNICRMSEAKQSFHDGNLFPGSFLGKSLPMEGFSSKRTHTLKLWKNSFQLQAIDTTTQRPRVYQRIRLLALLALTVNLLRPFKRRPFKTLRPSDVELRLRKPCTRTRRRFLG